jgi:hypothetical protein
MRWAFPLLAAVHLLGLAAAPALAQGQTCEITPPLPRDMKRLGGGAGPETIYFSGPVHFVCTGGTTVKADSAVYVRGVSLQLIGHVFYGDSVKTLTADAVDYIPPEGVLFARGDVVLTDRKSESTIRGPRLEYRRAGEGRPEAVTIVQDRPHAVLRPRRAEAADAPADTAAQPLEVDADWMEFRGESQFRAVGRVEFRRGEARGASSEAEFDEAAERLVLSNGAWIEDGEFRLIGDRIEAYLSGEHLRETTATAAQKAVLVARDLQVEAPFLRMYFEEGKLTRLVGEGQPAVAVARDYRLTADSIDALAPGQALEQVIAVGGALAERLPDSLDVGLPAPIDRDWLRGDTIIGYFAASPEPQQDSAAASDSTQAKRVLERLVAVGEGGGARAMYRSRERGEGGAERPGVDYMTADRITLFLEAGEVRRMEAEGTVRGIHLEPTGSQAEQNAAGEERSPPATSAQ